jgi:hypothetical protein
MPAHPGRRLGFWGLVMGGLSRFGGVAVFGLALTGCAGSPAPVASTGAPAALAFSLDTPVERIAADGRGRAVLQRDLPGLMASGQYVLFEDMSLAQIASLSSGQLTKTKLDIVAVDLAGISAPAQQEALR